MRSLNIVKGRSGIVLSILILSLTVTAFWVVSLDSSGFMPIGYDTFYHIKYATAILQAEKVITTNPYFPSYTLAYSIGSHIIVADLSLLSGASIVSIIVLSPLLFGILIILMFFAFASRYLTRKYAVIASLLFYAAASVPAPETAVNGATIANSLLFPYVAVLLGIAIFYCSLLVLSLDLESYILDLLLGLTLGTLLLAFDLLALTFVAIVIGYVVLNHSLRQLRHRLFSFFVAAAWSSFYWVHILLAGLPTQTGAFSTYAEVNLLPSSTGASYINILTVPIVSLLFVGLLLAVFGKLRFTSNFLARKEIRLLLSIIIVLVFLSQAWRIGFVLDNDLFTYYMIGGAAILSTLVLVRIGNILQMANLEKVATIIIVLLMISGPGLAFFSVNGFGISEASPYAPVIDWFNAHGDGAVVVSPNSNVLFEISSMSDILPLSIPSIVSDYYVSDLSARQQAIQTIFGNSLQNSLQTIQEYNVTYLLTEYPQPINSIFNSPYFSPVFPVQSCYQGSSASYDFDGDGIAESFDKFVGQTYQVYLLNNTRSSNQLSLTYMFNPKTYGPVQIFVNGTLVQQLTGSERGVWQSVHIDIPNSLIGSVEYVRILNNDPANEWYLQDIGIGSSPGCSQASTEFRIFSVVPISSTSLGTQHTTSIDNTNASNYDTLVWNGENMITTMLWANSTKSYNLTLNDMYDARGTIGPVLGYVNNRFVGYLYASNSAMQGVWINQNLTIPSSILNYGWNTFSFVNFDQANDWYLDHIGLNPVSNHSGYSSSQVLLQNQTSSLSLAWSGDNSQAYLVANDFFQTGIGGPVEAYVNGNYVGYFSTDTSFMLPSQQKQFLSVSSKFLGENNTVVLVNSGKSICIFDNLELLNNITALHPSRPPNLSEHNFTGSEWILQNGTAIPFYPVSWSGGSVTAFLYAGRANLSVLTVEDLFHPAGTVGPIIAYLNGVQIGTLEVTSQNLRGIWRIDSFNAPPGTIKLGWNNVTFVNDDKANQWEIASVSLS